MRSSKLRLGFHNDIIVMEMYFQLANVDWFIMVYKENYFWTDWRTFHLDWVECIDETHEYYKQIQLTLKDICNVCRQAAIVLNKYMRWKMFLVLPFKVSNSNFNLMNSFVFV